MKKLYFTISLLTAMMWGCNSTDKTQENATAAQTTTAPQTAENSSNSNKNCYEFVFKEDLTQLVFIQNGEEVTGEYNILPHEKDGAVGKLKGKMQGDKIIADWSYVIEGSEQSEEVQFVVEGDKVYQLIGELDDINGKMVMKDASKAKKGDAMTKVACK